MTATRAAIDQARRNEQPIIKIGNEFQPRDIMMNALRRHAAMAGSTGARWDPRFDTDSTFYLPKWKSDAFCNPALDQLLAEHQIEQLALAGLQASACVTGYREKHPGKRSGGAAARRCHRLRTDAS